MPTIRLDAKNAIDTKAPEVLSDGLRIWVGGESGSGKSTACMLIASQFVAQGGQALVLDPHGEYGALWELRPKSVQVYGYGENWIEPESVDLVLHHISEGQTVVLDLSHWVMERKVRTKFVGHLIAGLYALRQKSRGTTLVVVEEAHLFAPQVQQKDDVKTIDAFVGALTGGRKFGLHFVLATQRQSLVDSNVLSQCNVRLFLRISENKDWKNVVRQYIPPSMKDCVTWYQEDDKTDINKFDSGDALLISRWFPIQRIHLNRPSVPVRTFREDA